MVRPTVWSKAVLVECSISGVGGFEGSGGVRASSSSAAAKPPTPLYKEIFTFCMDPTEQFMGVRTPGPSPASYDAVQHRKWRLVRQHAVGLTERIGSFVRLL